jgi:hypothetical protein
MREPVGEVLHHLAQRGRPVAPFTRQLERTHFEMQLVPAPAAIQPESQHDRHAQNSGELPR